MRYSITRKVSKQRHLGKKGSQKYTQKDRENRGLGCVFYLMYLVLHLTFSAGMN